MAVLYTQSEADDLIAMGKWIDRGAWEDRKEGQGRWCTENIKVLPNDDRAGRLSFGLRMRTNPATDEFNVALWANLRPKQIQELSRYDFSLGSHTNPEGFAPPRILPRVIHAHRYSEHAEERLRDWDAYATPLDLSSDGSPGQVRDRILQRFLKDMNIDVRSAEAMSELFGRRH